ncbi:hypothetical protein ACPV30_04370 [Photobacterium damselae]|uniref:hypothetical protein n=1 Tax=Photobacterium damselae TaxID=38293 RepID=UPI0002E5415F|nr:hypothetical protein [Photobacterium damselae]
MDTFPAKLKQATFFFSTLFASSSAMATEMNTLNSHGSFALWLLISVLGFGLMCRK